MLARLALVVVLALPLSACSTDDDAAAPAVTTAPPAATTGAATTAVEEPPAGEPTRFRLYYLEGEHLAAVAAEASGEPTAQETLEALVENAGGAPSELPEGTVVNRVTSGGGTAVADLSEEFASGGGSLSMQARVAQVVFTLTQWPWIERVTIRLDGEDVEAIGGEGVPARELTRADFANVLPPVFVDVPVDGAFATSPLAVAGSASVFEANVSLRLETRAGDALVESFATAAEGAPGRGPFETTIAFEVDEPTEAVLVAYEAAADDSGAERHAVRVPVTLCPSPGC